jgi:hypothetical protein
LPVQQILQFPTARLQEAANGDEVVLVGQIVAPRRDMKRDPTENRFRGVIPELLFRRLRVDQRVRNAGCVISVTFCRREQRSE